MRRFLIVLCILAALVLAALKPARGALTDAQKCAADEISATGNDSLCALRARIAADTRPGNVDPDYLRAMTATR